MSSIEINSDLGLTDRKVVFQYLSKKSYWAKNIPKEIFDKSLNNSLCFNALVDGKQAGFARVISDLATYGYLADVFVLEEYRGGGISKMLMKAVVEHPELQNLRRITLATSDAHGLYEQFGFTKLKSPQIFMELHQPGLYERLRKDSN